MQVCAITAATTLCHQDKIPLGTDDKGVQVPITGNIACGIFPTALLKSNSYTIKFMHGKYTIQRFLVHSYSHHWPR